jgi:type III secretion system chaperone SycN
MSASYALSEFARGLGLPDVSLPPQGVVNMQLAEGLRLSVEESGDEILVYTTLDTPHLDSARVLAVLQACDLRRSAPNRPAVQVAQQGAGADMQLIMLIRWPEHNLQASQLHTALSIFAQCRREWLGLAA